MDLLKTISLAVQKGDAQSVKQNVQNLIDQGVGAQRILDQGLFDGMGVIGYLFKEDEVFVPEVIMAAKGHRIQVKLKSTESPYIYYVMKNKQNSPDRLELKKYDPVVRKHVIFKEAR